MVVDETSLTPKRAEVRLDGVRRVIRRARRDRPTGERLLDACRHLGPVEVLAQAAALDDREARRLDALVGREPRAAAGALASSADGSVIKVAGVHDPGVTFAAVGAAHGPGCLRRMCDHHPWWS